MNSSVNSVVDFSLATIMSMDHNTPVQCWRVGHQVPIACKAASYSIHSSQKPLRCTIARPSEIPDVNRKWTFHVHGSGCMGHIGYIGTDGIYTIPLSLMTKTLEFQSPLYSLHDRLATGRLDACSYQTHLFVVVDTTALREQAPHDHFMF